LTQELPFPGQQLVQTRCGKIGDTGEDVGEPGVGVDIVGAACSFPGHGAPLVGATAVDGALDLEQRIGASDRLLLRIE
jgi:hypothetical protein